MGSRDIINYVVVCSGILQSIIAIWGCRPPITTHNKAMPRLSYRVKVSRYNATCTSDHLYRKTTYVLHLIYTSLIVTVFDKNRLQHTRLH